MKNIDIKLYTIHSIVVRLKNSDELGYSRCYTCDKPLTYDNAECGHYPLASRGDKKFAWDIILAKPQCSYCNGTLQGNPDTFRDRLIHELGIEYVSKVEFEARKSFKWFVSDKYRLFKELKKEAQKLLKDKTFNVQLP